MIFLHPHAKDVEGFPGYYVTPDGHLYSPRGRVFGSRNKNGARVKLTKDGVKTTVQLRLLIAQAFVENPSGAVSVRPINGDYFDDRAANLAWCAAGKANALPGTRPGYTSPAQRADICAAFVAGASGRSLARQYGLTQGSVARILSGMTGKRERRPALSPGRKYATDDQRRRIFELRAQGLTQRAIGQLVGLSQVSVRYWLKRPVEARQA